MRVRYHEVLRDRDHVVAEFFGALGDHDLIRARHVDLERLG
jgi:hypothetical protein